MILRRASRRVREAAESRKSPVQSPSRMVLDVNDVGGGIIDSQPGTTEFTARSSAASARAQDTGGDVHAGNAAPTGGHRGAKNLVPRLVTWSPGR
jgi:hypothetical protein